MNTYEYDVHFADGTSQRHQVKAVSAQAAEAAVWQTLNGKGQQFVHANGVTKLSTFRLVVAAPGPRFTIEGKPDDNYTVEEASRFLTCHQPVPVSLLAKLGRDCSMVCSIRGAAWTERPTPTKQWLKERAYPFAIIREVFELNPDTAPYIPKG